MHESADEHTMTRILGKNDELAGHNREHFDELGLFVLNFMSAPGAGKTSLLAAALAGLNPLSCSVIEGDMVGDLDAERLRRSGTEVFQISTGKSCHLDALMVSRLLHFDNISAKDIVFIENVGNLVCPAEFALGEHKRVVLLSVTEGDDKPLKYPVIFRNCEAVVFTKCDLLPYVDFDLVAAARHVHAINPNARTFALSVVDKRGLTEFKDWILEGLKANSEQRAKGTCHVPVHSR
jgi:hydrogenase nickel incorporation protein HypB